MFPVRLERFKCDDETFNKISNISERRISSTDLKPPHDASQSFLTMSSDHRSVLDPVNGSTRSLAAR